MERLFYFIFKYQEKSIGGGSKKILVYMYSNTNKPLIQPLNVLGMFFRHPEAYGRQAIFPWFGPLQQVNFCISGREIVLTNDPRSSNPQSPARPGAGLGPSIGTWLGTLNCAPE